MATGNHNDAVQLMERGAALYQTPVPQESLAYAAYASGALWARGSF